MCITKQNERINQLIGFFFVFFFSFFLSFFLSFQSTAVECYRPVRAACVRDLSQFTVKLIEFLLGFLLCLVWYLGRWTGSHLDSSWSIGSCEGSREDDLFEKKKGFDSYAGRFHWGISTRIEVLWGKNHYGKWFKYDIALKINQK